MTRPYLCGQRNKEEISMYMTLIYLHHLRILKYNGTVGKSYI